MGAVDRDGDGTPNWLDADADGDSLGLEVVDANDGGLDAGRQDCDGDGVPNYLDEMQCTVEIPDSDADGVLDDRDNCVADFNPNQADCDEDGEGDICDSEGDVPGSRTCSPDAPYIPEDGRRRGCVAASSPVDPGLPTVAALALLVFSRRHRAVPRVD